MRKLFCGAMAFACLLGIGCAAAVHHEETVLPPQEDGTYVLEIQTPEPITSFTPQPTATGTPQPTPSLTPPPATETPIPDYFPSDIPEKDGVYKLVVYFGTQSVVAYRAEGGRWIQERVMICSTGKKNSHGDIRGTHEIPVSFPLRGKGPILQQDHQPYPVSFRPDRGNREESGRRAAADETGGIREAGNACVGRLRQINVF